MPALAHPIVSLPEPVFASKILFGATAILILALPFVDNPEMIFENLISIRLAASIAYPKCLQNRVGSGR